MPTTRCQLHDAMPPQEPSETLGEVIERIRLLERAVAVPARGEIPVVPDLVVPGRDGTPVIGYRGPTGHDDGYRGFEDVFRGSEAEIRRRMRVYLPLLRAHAPVLEMGCGRGELLDLLREAGVPARGVDIDPSMVRRSREKVLEVTEGDALGYLVKEPDASAGAVFSAQLVEHLRTGALEDDLLAVPDYALVAVR